VLTSTTSKGSGSDFIYNAFGSNAFRKHKQVKAFLSLQDPILPVPSRDVNPNWKIRPILDWMEYIGPKAVLLGECASVDEMTIGFQGSHKDKRRITYKADKKVIAISTIFVTIQRRRSMLHLDYRRCMLVGCGSLILSLMIIIKLVWMICTILLHFVVLHSST
jgi:hypothetical protein